MRIYKRIKDSFKKNWKYHLLALLLAGFAVASRKSADIEKVEMEQGIEQERF